MMKDVFNASAQGDEIYPKSALGQGEQHLHLLHGPRKEPRAAHLHREEHPDDRFRVDTRAGATGLRHLQEQPADDTQDAGNQRRASAPAGGRGPVRPYFLEEEHYAQPERFPYNISPLAFMVYDETKIYEYVEALGWVKPKDTDPNSTNCLLNSYAINVHLDQSRFHPYVAELAGLVREGRMDREEALERINTMPSENVVNFVTDRLGVARITPAETS